MSNADSNPNNHDSSSRELIIEDLENAFAKLNKKYLKDKQDYQDKLSALNGLKQSFENKELSPRQMMQQLRALVSHKTGISRGKHSSSSRNKQAQPMSSLSSVSALGARPNHFLSHESSMPQLSQGAQRSQHASQQGMGLPMIAEPSGAQSLKSPSLMKALLEGFITEKLMGHIGRSGDEFECIVLLHWLEVLKQSEPPQDIVLLEHYQRLTNEIYEGLHYYNDAKHLRDSDLKRFLLDKIHSIKFDSSLSEEHQKLLAHRHKKVRIMPTNASKRDEYIIEYKKLKKIIKSTALLKDMKFFYRIMA